MPHVLLAGACTKKVRRRHEIFWSAITESAPSFVVACISTMTSTLNMSPHKNFTQFTQHWFTVVTVGCWLRFPYIKMIAMLSDLISRYQLVYQERKKESYALPSVKKTKLVDWYLKVFSFKLIKLQKLMRHFIPLWSDATLLKYMLLVKE